MTDKTKFLVLALALTGVGAVTAPTALAATVLVMGGTTGSTPTAAQMSTLSAALGWSGDDLVAVTTPEQLWPVYGTMTYDESTAIGQQDLAAAIAATSGPIIVDGTSQSGHIISLEEAALATDPNAPPTSELSFVVEGNPDRPGGIETILPAGSNFLGATFDAGAPVSPYNTTDIAYEYDPIAHFPTQPLNLLTDANAVASFLENHVGLNASQNYNTVNLAAVPTSDITKDGVTTYYTIPEATLPLLEPLQQLGVPASIIAPLNAALKPIVDAGYASTTTPVTTPAPATPSALAAVQSVARKLPTLQHAVHATHASVKSSRTNARHHTGKSK